MVVYSMEFLTRYVTVQAVELILAVLATGVFMMVKLVRGGLYGSTKTKRVPD